MTTEYKFRTMADVRAINRAIGHHWFERSTMRFFNSQVESGLYGGHYFVTSERMDLDRPKRYSIRVVKNDGTIDTYGDFQLFTNLQAARNSAKALARSDDWQERLELRDLYTDA